jgi:diacylglycerol O-acyltransferase / wax synthase
VKGDSCNDRPVQQHLERLTSTDATFLHQEGRASHMHIGGVLVFEGPAPAFEEFLEHIRSRMHRIPRYRQKLAHPPLDTGRPLWVDDPDFNLEYHVRHTGLPAPGSEEQLLNLTARIASQRLDRTKPLWELWVVEGLEPAAPGEPERFALLSKTHHSLVDGVSSFDLATALFDLTEEPPAPDEAALVPWQPAPEPTPLELLLSGVRGAIGTTTGLAVGAIDAALNPNRTVGALLERLEGMGLLAWAALNPAPQTPLNVPIGPHRRFAVVRLPLSDLKEIKNAFGGTVNDVVLSVVSGSLRKWLHSRGLRTEGVEMRALVPVSVRTADEKGALGNRLTVMRGPLPVYISDPVTCLRVVSKEMDDLKESKQAVGAATLAAATDLAPPAVLAQASRLQFSTRLFNLLVTNIPGPQIPLYVLGRKALDLFPLAFLPEDHALAIAIISYNGQIEFGLLGDYDALPDIDLIADGIADTVAEMLAQAREANGHTPKPDTAAAPSEKDSPRQDGNNILPSGNRSQRRGPGADMRAKRPPRRP